MDAEQIVKLSQQAVQELLDSRSVQSRPNRPSGQRRTERWPFPGAVELWLPSESYGERHLLATLHNLNAHGLAMRSRHPVPTDTRIALAIHEPEMSLYGHAVVRHCTRAQVGYLIGVEFCFTPFEEEQQEEPQEGDES